MVKKTVTYTDYNGVERTEDFYFNLTEAEASEMELSVEGGLSNMIDGIIKAKNVPAVVKIFKDLLLRSYGEKSADGRRFIKSPELSTAFSQTEAYSILFMDIGSDPEKAADFMNAIMPQSLRAKAEEESNVKKLPEKNAPLN